MRVSEREREIFRIWEPPPHYIFDLIRRLVPAAGRRQDVKATAASLVGGAAAGEHAYLFDDNAELLGDPRVVQVLSLSLSLSLSFSLSLPLSLSLSLSLFLSLSLSLSLSFSVSLSLSLSICLAIAPPTPPLSPRHSLPPSRPPASRRRIAGIAAAHRSDSEGVESDDSMMTRSGPLELRPGVARMGCSSWP